jgi:hypothetical protein
VGCDGGEQRWHFRGRSGRALLDRRDHCHILVWQVSEAVKSAGYRIEPMRAAASWRREKEAIVSSCYVLSLLSWLTLQCHVHFYKSLHPTINS